MNKTVFTHLDSLSVEQPLQLQINGKDKHYSSCIWLWEFWIYAYTD